MVTKTNRKIVRTFVIDSILYDSWVNLITDRGYTISGRLKVLIESDLNELKRRG